MEVKTFNLVFLYWLLCLSEAKIIDPTCESWSSLCHKSPDNGNNVQSCQMDQLFSCPQYEICTQMSQDSDFGECTCHPGYQRNSSNVCDKVDPSIKPIGTDSQGRSLAVGIVVVMLATCSGVLLFIAFKKRWLVLPWLRRRNQDTMLLGEDESDVDPIA